MAIYSDDVVKPLTDNAAWRFRFHSAAPSIVAADLWLIGLF
jgi:hypothetical protein